MYRCLPGLLLGCLIALPQSGDAGAWPRDKGTWFASVKQTFAMTSFGPVSELTAAYLEYGLNGRLTLGAKYDRLVLGGATALGFARWHLSQPGATYQFAAEIGAGHVTETDGRSGTILSFAGIAGRGFETRFGSGWAEADLRVSQKSSTDQRWANLDLTLGLNPTDKSHIILQTRFFADKFSTDVELAPAYVRRLFGRTKVLMGLTYSVASENAFGVELGTWLEF